VIDNLKKRELPGLAGISDSGAVIFYTMFGVARDAFLAMDADKVVELNDLEQITYEPETLIQDNMEDLVRVWQQADTSRIFQNLGDYILAGWQKSNPSLHYGARYFGWPSQLDHAARKKRKPPRIDTIKELAKYIKELTFDFILPENPRWREDFEALSDRDWIESVRTGLQPLDRIYGDEGEWDVKSDKLTIPAQSRLTIMHGALGDDFADFERRYYADELDDFEKARIASGFSGRLKRYAKFIEKRDYIERELGGTYKIIWMPRDKFDKALSRHFDRKYKAAKVADA
jgi:hypothetical protein